MHYKNNRPVQLGDQTLFRGYDNVAHVGFVTKLAPGSDTCNLTAIETGTGVVYSSITAKEAVHVDDAFDSVVPPVQDVEAAS